MKHARKALVFMILLVTPLLLSGVISPVAFEARTQPTQSLTKVSTPSYTAHDPIWLLNDSAFHDMAADEEWDGDGSSGFPYIIEGYNITADVTGILIQHVTVSFEIRSCYIANIVPWSSFGIGIIFIVCRVISRAA